MRRVVLVSITSLALVVAPWAASAAIIDLEASMDCAQANAGIGTCDLGGSGTGSASITFDDETNLLSWNISWSGLSAPVTAAHFHGPALPDENAGVTVGFDHTINPNVGSATLDAVQAAELLNELWYINVHSSNFPAGEIRGQVTLVPEPGMLALLGASLAMFGAAYRRHRRG
jgi:hypothetical protein